MDKGGGKGSQCDPELPEAESLYHPPGATAVTERKKRVDVSEPLRHPVTEEPRMLPGPETS